MKLLLDRLVLGLQELAQAEAESLKLASQYRRRAAEINAERCQLVAEFLEANYPALRKIRAGLPQKSIAETADVLQPYVSYMERGQTAPIGIEAQIRLLQVYAELEKHHARRVSKVRKASGIPDEQRPGG